MREMPKNLSSRLTRDNYQVPSLLQCGEPYRKTAFNALQCGEPYRKTAFNARVRVQ
jgi:hypothetical protein